jgi:hypothetical protein
LVFLEIEASIFFSELALMASIAAFLAPVARECDDIRHHADRVETRA